MVLLQDHLKYIPKPATLFAKQWAFRLHFIVQHATGWLIVRNRDYLLTYHLQGTSTCPDPTVLRNGDSLNCLFLHCSSSEIKAEAQDSAQLALSSLPTSDMDARETSCGSALFLVASLFTSLFDDSSV
ncbi:Cyclin delta-3 isoform 1 [Gossypium australe]|uniref:Cyclin delta-3 isoform 1 n=1 Tax=Gossypium australe TaxID=47621 RepID=A0A5B6VZB0_9ROSI|nr:Cyclin delta-3 isoform 1 [Gossypium australe]